MKTMIIRALVATGLSIAASLAIALAVVPAMGGTVDAIVVAMCIACPTAIAMPVSIWTQVTKRRLNDSREALVTAHRELADAHERLARMHASLVEKSQRDEMTGLLNRETFITTLEKLRRRSDSGALLIVDADHFKSINDEHGHLTGDEALRRISGAISAAVRDRDIVGRIGGEEFAVFLPDTRLAEAGSVAERLRRGVEEIDFVLPTGRTRELTVSIGGTMHRPGIGLSALMREADRRLYEAKRQGRNRSVLVGALGVDTDIAADRAA